MEATARTHPVVDTHHALVATCTVYYGGRLSTPSLAVCKNRGRRPGESYHMIRVTADVMDSRCNSLFTFVSTATEKLESPNKFQMRSKSYPVKHIRVRSLTAEGWL